MFARLFRNRCELGKPLTGQIGLHINSSTATRPDTEIAMPRSREILGSTLRDTNDNYYYSRSRISEM
jgi:hypothetical protein